MGLFGKKNVEPEPEPQPQPAKPAKAAKPAPKPEPKPEAKQAKVVTKKPAPEPSRPSYGIQNAIELMRQLPEDNVPLVVSVVKKTLESLHVDIASIIADAEKRHDRINDRIAGLETEIEEFEEEIAARKQEIKALSSDRDETVSVKERLELAQKGGVGVAASGASKGGAAGGAAGTIGAAVQAGAGKAAGDSDASWGSQLAARANQAAKS